MNALSMVNDQWPYAMCGSASRVCLCEPHNFARGIGPSCEAGWFTAPTLHPSLRQPERQAKPQYPLPPFLRLKIPRSRPQQVRQ